jgi:photosystem II stability/assembly factor-like uncharacterized protein
MKHLIYCLSLVIFWNNISNAQSTPSPTPANERLKAHNDRLRLKEESYFAHVPFTNIGPSICSGRIVDVDVNPSRPNEMYVAYASGGVWYSDNNGTSFTPVFDHEACMTVGDIAVNWSTKTIWVGTGENNSSRSSYSGVGIYRSPDGGKTWKHMGLDETHHIGRIVLHPFNPNIVHVASIGALYSKNQNRGIYSTSDGGITWRQTLFINDSTGVIDMVIDPSNPNTLYAASWERSRTAWNFTESGPGSGIYVSHDSGRNWKWLTTAESGFPTGVGTGRIGLELVKEKNQNVLYAIVDNQHERPEKKEEEDKLTKSALLEMHPDTFLKLTDKKIKAYLSENDFPSKYTADTLRTLIKEGKITPATLVEYTMNANSKLLETEVIGPELYKSLDGGKTWVRTHKDFLNSLFYTYGYYFGQVRVSRSHPNKVYLLGVPILKSNDYGATWTSIGDDNVHADHHALWINPKQDGHLVCGNDGGINISYDDGAHWSKCNQPAVGQFYSVSVDDAKPFNVYGGLQDNGVWVGPSTYKASTSWQSDGAYPYKFLMGGDGMQVAIDRRDNNTIYTGYQFGNYYRLSRDGKTDEAYITPRHELGERPHRWNWETPVHLSNHNQDILYMGGEKVFRSMDQGNNWKAISPDLTLGEKTGDVAFGTIVSLHESPRVFGVVYAGTDDGLVHVTRDGGLSWKKITDGLPSSLWVSSLQAGQHADGAVYLTLNGYRWDHFTSYAYRSSDYGDTWERIGLNLPAEPVNVIKEDPHNGNILYAGTDHALYISTDQGKTFELFGDMPFTPVHDIAIQARDKVLVAATHGRSLYKANLKHVELTESATLDTLFTYNESLEIMYNERWGMRSASWMEFSKPKVVFPVYSPDSGDATIEVFADSLMVTRQSLKLKKGLGYYEYDLTVDSTSVAPMEHWANQKKKEDDILRSKNKDNGLYYLLPGKYKLMIVRGQENEAVQLEVKMRK